MKLIIHHKKHVSTITSQKNNGSISGPPIYNIKDFKLQNRNNIQQNFVDDFITNLITKLRSTQQVKVLELSERL